MSVAMKVLRRTGQTLVLPGALLLLFYVIGSSLLEEMESSHLQARYLSAVAREIRFAPAAGPSPSIRFPHSGPYDKRLGYEQLPDFIARLGSLDYRITEQARVSPWLADTADFGLFPIYREKTVAGLSLLDAHERPFYAARYPLRTYDRFESIPPLLVDTLLFIENRELLDVNQPTRNPAVDWGRLGKAVSDQALRILDAGHPGAGGSTLATQIEKFRHSPGGRTGSAKEKLRQMASASLRAYVAGEDTRAARQTVVVDYLNSVPLLAKAGYGEINGIGEGLWAWYGRDRGDVDRLLAAPLTEAPTAAQALAFKQALSLMIAQRRPGHYLRGGHDDLIRTTDTYLRLLNSAGVIGPALRDAALAAELHLNQEPLPPSEESYVARKAATALRTTLAASLDVRSLYDLDRIDVAVNSTLDATVQQGITQVLEAIRDPVQARKTGLYGSHMFSAGDDPSRVVFSFTLFERTPGANLLRVQTDNFDQPFDINSGSRLDLGSTAKLRTLVNYLQIIAELHHRYGDLEPAVLATMNGEGRDPLTRWAITWLTGAADRSLPAMLAAALERRYSASPAEVFFTGGGAHTFRNFKPEDNHQVLSVRSAFAESVNLVFVRLMRDVVRYTTATTVGDVDALLDDADNPRRQAYLARFADREGKEFLSRFYAEFRDQPAVQIESRLVRRSGLGVNRLAALYRTLEPAGDLAGFHAFLERQAPDRSWPERALGDAYAKHGADKMSLADRGYVARCHPLELWLAGFLRGKPDATLEEAIAASAEPRQAAAAWLYATRHQEAQNKRIRDQIEYETFLVIGRDWRRLGYPFETLTPSYATAIGASGDRPAALAELVGIIANKGLRLPVVRIEGLRFAAGTPFETRLQHQPGPSERVLPEAVADAVRGALRDVVQDGTARRLRDALRGPDGRPIEVGGKTGTGDHRYDTVAANGTRTSSRTVNRAATFVFFIGDRYYGNVTTYAPEPYADGFRFTSSLPVQLLKSLAPTLTPLLAPKDEVRLVAVRR